MSWLLMGMDGPVNVGIIERLPKPEIGAAAFAVLISLSIWIESPIIDLLATATTLASSASRYRLLRKFVVSLIIWVTAVHAMVSATPLYWVVTEHIMGLPHSLAACVRPGLIVLIPWSALIGWRRAHQGVMIRSGLTKAIGIGTTLRGITLVGVALGLMVLTPGISSVVIAAMALISSVAVEACFVHFVSASAVQALPQEGANSTLTTSKLWGFHFPLTATTMVNLLVGPLVAAGLARTPDPIRALASYQVASAFFFLFRMITFCLPEVVITLGKDPQSLAALRRFSLGIGLMGSSLMLTMAVTRSDEYLFRVLLRTPIDLLPMAHLTFLGCCALPLIDSAQSFVRGVLTAQHRTTARLVAVGAATAGLMATLLLGLMLKWPAYVLVGSAITASIACELVVLVLAVQKPAPQH